MSLESITFFLHDSFQIRGRRRFPAFRGVERVRNKRWAKYKIVVGGVWRTVRRCSMTTLTVKQNYKKLMKFSYWFTQPWWKKSPDSGQILSSKTKDCTGFASLKIPMRPKKCLPAILSLGPVASHHWLKSERNPLFSSCGMIPWFWLCSSFEALEKRRQSIFIPSSVKKFFQDSS